MKNETKLSKPVTIILYTIATLMFLIPIGYFSYNNFYAKNPVESKSMLTIINQNISSTSNVQSSLVANISLNTISLSSSSISIANSSTSNSINSQENLESKKETPKEQPLVVLAPPATPPPAPQPQAYSYSSYDCTLAYSSEMLNLINNHRAENGASPLSLDSSLNSVACAHTIWMSQTNSLSHEGYDGTSPFERCKLAGTVCMAENVADNSEYSAYNLFQQFKNSPPHNTNMINPNYTVVGLGFDGIYITQVFR